MRPKRRARFAVSVRHRISDVRPFCRSCWLMALLPLLLSVSAFALTPEDLRPWLDSVTDEELARSLESLEDVDTAGEDGLTLLQYALCHAPGQAEQLVNAGLSVNAETPQGGNALHHLYQCGHRADDTRIAPLTRLLLNAGADRQRQDDRGRTPLHHALAALDDGRGAVHIYRDAALLLLARGADPSQTDNDYITPLHLAHNEHSAQITELMLDIGAGMNATDRLGRTPLWLAAEGDQNSATFLALFERGASVLLGPEDQPGTIERTFDSNDWRKINALLRADHALPAIPPAQVFTNALFDHADEATLMRLLATGLSLEGEPGELAWLAAERHDDALLDLMLEAGLDINLQIGNSWPPLLPASTEASRRLLARGADPAATGPDGGTAITPGIPLPDRLNLGQQPVSAEKTTLLLEHNYPVNLRDHLGQSALEAAVRANRLWQVRQLLDAGADATLSSDGTGSLLPLAIARDRLPMIQALHRAISDGPTRHPDLLLSYLQADLRDRAVLEWLLLQGYDTEARDPRGNTPLLLAAASGREALVQLLLEYGADADALNESGCGLGCYQREAVEVVTGYQWPPLNTQPVAFFTLAFAPALILWLIWLALLMKDNKPLLGAGVRLLLALALGLIGGATLFYQCEPCLLEESWQLPATACMTVLLMLLFMLIGRRRETAADEIATGS